MVLLPDFAAFATYFPFANGASWTPSKISAHGQEKKITCESSSFFSAQHSKKENHEDKVGKQEAASHKEHCEKFRPQTLKQRREEEERLRW